jgi:hypothetical protein
MTAPPADFNWATTGIAATASRLQDPVYFITAKAHDRRWSIRLYHRKGS